MGWRHDWQRFNQKLCSFDLGRVTLIGWLTVVFSFVAGVAASIALARIVLPALPANRDISGLFLLAGIGHVALFFFVAKFMFNAAGLTLLQRESNQLVQSSAHAIADLRRRVGKARAWRLFFLLLMTLGFALPCGISVALASGADKGAPGDITPPQVFAMIAMGLPPIGLAGWLLMRRDLLKSARALAVADQAERMGLAFSQAPGQDALSILEKFDVYMAANRIWCNCCNGQSAGKSIKLLDCATALPGFLWHRYWLSGVHSQTVVVVMNLDSRLPDFLLAPKGWMAKLWSAPGSSQRNKSLPDIFTSDFEVVGEEAGRLDRVLSGAAGSMIQARKVTVEVCSGDMVYYRHGKLAKPESIGALIDDVLRFATTIEESCPRE
jgi:hypothetical protein